MHKARADINTSRAMNSLEDWAMQIAPAETGETVLDLGCGRGKLVFPYAEAVGPGGSVLGLDQFADAVEDVRNMAARSGRENVDAIVGDLNTVPADLGGRRFDLIVSSYAIYYADDMAGLLSDLKKLLSDAGRVFVCGPGEGTNREMYELVRSAAPDKCPESQPDFISESEIERVAAAYQSTAIHRMPNKIDFPDPESLLRWWTSHSSFVPEAEERLREAVGRHFSDNETFSLTKNVLGVTFSA
jgi:ubiquinone/menaquinone biosynthesis C-methylase UbiE